MDYAKTGNLICRLRKENHMTQLQLAEKMNISDKTVSKWERGVGCPDVSLLAQLSDIFKVDIERLLSGELQINDSASGNLKNMHFYVCPDCGNLITSMTSAAVSCCGKKLQMIRLRKADDSEKLSVEIIENEYFISSDHEMSRNHYISFVGLLTGDCMMLRKQYPEWDLQLRIPVFAHGKLFWYCTQHGFFWQNV
ncbi:MAG: helix-turn-helix domain-containing protein [Candidatus Choladocola sp.]|nr:helix-turn-helix domain-containing protein [Candidatus Choladocola sp.]